MNNDGSQSTTVKCHRWIIEILFGIDTILILIQLISIIMSDIIFVDRVKYILITLYILSLSVFAIIRLEIYLKLRNDITNVTQSLSEMPSRTRNAFLALLIATLAFIVAGYLIIIGDISPHWDDFSDKYSYNSMLFKINVIYSTIATFIVLVISGGDLCHGQGNDELQPLIAI
jgi:hypothetical protein